MKKSLRGQILKSFSRVHSNFQNKIKVFETEYHQFLSESLYLGLRIKEMDPSQWPMFDLEEKRHFFGYLRKLSKIIDNLGSHYKKTFIFEKKAVKKAALVNINHKLIQMYIPGDSKREIGKNFYFLFWIYLFQD